VEGGNGYACINENTVDEGNYKKVGGELCYDVSSCLEKRKTMGFEGCAVKLVFAERCGVFEDTIGSCKYDT
jgi:hypothetical protein